MKAEEYEKMYEAEQTYFWFVAKQRTISRMLSKFLEPGPKTILDLGCGTGTNLDGLKEFGEAYGIDQSDTALEFCRKRGLSLLARAEAGHIPFKENSFDLVTALDLLEHLEDDETALKEAYRALKPGGLLLLTVPAYPSLFGAHDYAMGHLRRYSKESLASIVKGFGFSTEKISYYMSLIFPATLVIKLFQKLFGSRTETIPYRINPFLNKFFLLLCELEARMLVYMNMPAGSSVLLILKKPVSGVS